jgi:hypothetical protein
VNVASHDLQSSVTVVRLYERVKVVGPDFEHTVSFGRPYSVVMTAGRGSPLPSAAVGHSMPHCPQPIHAWGPRISRNAATSFKCTHGGQERVIEPRGAQEIDRIVWRPRHGSLAPAQRKGEDSSRCQCEIQTEVACRATGTLHCMLSASQLRKTLRLVPQKKARRSHWLVRAQATTCSQRRSE